MREGIDNIVGNIKIMELLATNSFEEWFLQNYSKSMIMRAFKGYKFYVMATLRILASSIYVTPILEFSQNYTLYRANFVGKNVEEFSDDCELYKILQELNNWDKKVYETKNFPELQKILKKFINSFGKILKQEILNEDIERKKLKIVLSKVTYLFFNDTGRFFPNTYKMSMLPNRVTKAEHKSSLFGYAHTNLFIWELILGKNKVPEEIKNIVNSKIWVGEDIVGKDSLISKNKKQIIEFDSFFTIIREKIINNLSVHILDQIIFLNPDYSKNFLKQIIKNNYLVSKETVGEKLKRKLYWHNVELLGLNNEGLFSGIPSFELILRGSVNLNQDTNNFEPIKVIKIKHPVAKNQNNYSYGVLIERYGLFSDYSGWIISYNCANDHSGFGGSNFKNAEKIIKNFSNQGFIKLIETTISNKDFKKEFSYKFNIKQKLKKSKQTGTLISSPKEDEGNLKGLTLELLSFYIESTKKYDSIKWGVGKEKDIDIVCKKGNAVKLVECKINPNSWDLSKEYEKLEEKSKDYSEKNIKCEFLFYYPPSPQDHTYLITNKINFKCFKTDETLRMIIGKKRIDYIKKLIENISD